MRVITPRGSLTSCGAKGCVCARREYSVGGFVWPWALTGEEGSCGLVWDKVVSEVKSGFSSTAALTLRWEGGGQLLVPGH